MTARRVPGADAIVAAALAAAGTDRFTSDSFGEGLGVLLESLAQCRSVSAAGLASIERQMVGHLANRFAIEAYLRDHGELERAPVEAPIFVLGMPRTGTTLMVNLLHQDPAARTLRKWEVNLPVPPAATGALSSDPRCERLNAQRRREVAEGKLKTNIHFEWYDDPTECVYLLMQDFKSTSWDAFLPLPAYSEFLLGCDTVPTYRWHKRVLQHLQENNKGRWTLKAPGHALFARSLLQVYPDARLVWMHRDPKVALASLASLINGVHRRFQPEADHDWIRRHYPGQLAEHANRMLGVEREWPERVFHVQYDDLMRDPAEATERLYAEIGLPWSEEVQANVRGYVEAHPRGAHGEHRYGLDQFGIDWDEVRPLFEPYLERVARFSTDSFGS